MFAEYNEGSSCYTPQVFYQEHFKHFYKNEGDSLKTMLFEKEPFNEGLDNENKTQEKFPILLNSLETLEPTFEIKISNHYSG